MHTTELTPDADQLEPSQGIMVETLTALKIAIFNRWTVANSSQGLADENQEFQMLSKVRSNDTLKAKKMVRQHIKIAHVFAKILICVLMVCLIDMS
jgi:hypothetical protein